VIDAVLFDWGHTLIDFVWNEEWVEQGHRAGLAALGRDDELPDAEAVAAHFRERYQPLLWVPGTIEEIEYPGLVRGLLGHFGLEITDDELDRYLDAEHEVWLPAQVLHDDSHQLLDELRERDLLLGLVSNAFDPGWLLHRDLERSGLAERLDFAVFASEIGKRKPHRAIFETALGALDADPDRTLFVGDRIYEDVRGAAELGMTTVQALCFSEDEHSEGGVPDFLADEQLEVLAIVDGLLGG
jgi:putative hydrolase of the HAD superfamily